MIIVAGYHLQKTALTRIVETKHKHTLLRVFLKYLEFRIREIGLNRFFFLPRMIATYNITFTDKFKSSVTTHINNQANQQQD